MEAFLRGPWARNLCAAEADQWTCMKSPKFRRFLKHTLHDLPNPAFILDLDSELLRDEDGGLRVISSRSSVLPSYCFSSDSLVLETGRRLRIVLRIAYIANSATMSTRKARAAISGVLTSGLTTTTVPRLDYVVRRLG